MNEPNDAVQWRPVPGYEGIYKVSFDGQVIGPRGHVLAGWITRDGYHAVQLSVNGNRVTKEVHRIMGLAFFGPAEGRLVCHSDGNCRNNTISNLRYGTPSDNMLDMVRHGGHPGPIKTECKHGHPFDEENTFIFQSKHGNPCRRCRKCLRIRSARYYGKAKASKIESAA